MFCMRDGCLANISEDEAVPNICRRNRVALMMDIEKQLAQRKENKIESSAASDQEL